MKKSIKRFPKRVKSVCITAIMALVLINSANATELYKNKSKHQQQTKKTDQAKHNIKIKTENNNKYKSIPFNNP